LGGSVSQIGRKLQHKNEAVEQGWQREKEEDKQDERHGCIL
jgi:hypothetical protein